MGTHTEHEPLPERLKLFMNVLQSMRAGDHGFPRFYQGNAKSRKQRASQNLILVARKSRRYEDFISNDIILDQIVYIDSLLLPGYLKQIRTSTDRRQNCVIWRGRSCPVSTWMIYNSWYSSDCPSSWAHFTSIKAYSSLETPENCFLTLHLKCEYMSYMNGAWTL